MPENHDPEILPPIAEFPLLEDPNGILALFDDRAAGGEKLPILDLPRIKVGAGGVPVFTFTTVDGEDTAKKLEGVIVAWRTARIYWKSRAAGKKPPDCTSTDGFIGIGDPGGDCSRCPYARFGSAEKPDGGKGEGQACKEVRQVLFLMKGEMLPHLLNVPPTSIKAFQQYTLTLLSQRSADWGAITELTLEKAESADRIGYSRIVFRLGRKLDEGALPIFKSFHKRMRAVLKPIVIDAGTYEVIGQDPAPPPRRIAPPSPLPNSQAAPPPAAPQAHAPEPEANPENPDDIPF